MFKRVCLIIFIALLPSLAWGKSFFAGDTGKKRIVKIDESGKIVWQLDKIKPVDFTVLENGNLLFCHASTKGESYVREITIDKQVVWEYREKAELRSCQRLDDGTTLIGQTTDGLLRLVNSSGKVIKTIQIKSESRKPHSRMRIVRKGSDGLYYVAQHSEGIARAYNEEGEIIREFTHLKNTLTKADEVVKHACSTVTPFQDGYVLTSGLTELRLFNEKNELVWSLKSDEVPNVNIFAFTGTHVLDNGNIAVANWLGHGAKGKGHHFIEINRSKEIVWRYKNDTQFSYPSTIKMSP